VADAGLILTPSLEVGDALIAGALMPLYLLGLARALPTRLAPGARLRCAVVVMAAVWLALLVVQGDLPPQSGLEFLAGLLVLAVAAIAGFIIWSLLAWGFTLAMLVALKRAARPLTIDGWIAALCGEERGDAFARNRLTVLIGFGLARLHDGKVRSCFGSIKPARRCCCNSAGPH
jgi:hypothetical protein